VGFPFCRPVSGQPIKSRDGILPWTKIRPTNGAVEGMSNEIKSISHRSFGFRTAADFIAAIQPWRARLPPPGEER